MKNIKFLIKRVCAYTIDLVIVLILASTLSSIPVINKNIDIYQEKYDEYQKEYKDYSEYLNLIKSSYEDEEITEEEYNQLIQEEKYKDLIITKYDDAKISAGEYKQITEELQEELNTKTGEYSYILSKYGIYNTVITLVCTLLYFGVIQYFLKGQTIGKKLLRLKVVSASDKKLNILNYLLRSLIVNDILLNTIGTIFLMFASKKIYLQANSILTTLVSISEAIIIFLVVTREDGRGLHDLLFNTKVIDISDNDQNLETQPEHTKAKKVIEVNHQEDANKDETESTKKSTKSRKKQWSLKK